MFSKNLKLLRLKLNLSQKQFADAIFLSQGAVSQWQHDKTSPTISQLKIIADKFGCSIDELLGINTPTVHIIDVQSDSIFNIKLISAYRAASPQRQSIIRDMLHLPQEAKDKMA